MTALKLQQFVFVVLTSFLASATVLFGTTAVNWLAIDWSTWQKLISAIITGCLTYLYMWAAPQNKNFGLGSKKDKE
jgi:hypothetical protein